MHVTLSSIISIALICSRRAIFVHEPGGNLLPLMQSLANQGPPIIALDHVITAYIDRMRFKIDGSIMNDQSLF